MPPILIGLVEEATHAGHDILPRLGDLPVKALDRGVPGEDVRYAAHRDPIDGLVDGQLGNEDLVPVAGDLQEGMAEVILEDDAVQRLSVSASSSSILRGR